MKDKDQADKKIEEKIENLNNIYGDFSKRLVSLEDKQLLTLAGLEKKITDEKLKKIRQADK